MLDSLNDLVDMFSQFCYNVCAYELEKPVVGLELTSANSKLIQAPIQFSPHFFQLQRALHSDQLGSVSPPPEGE